jgi:hypothetical protein
VSTGVARDEAWGEHVREDVKQLTYDGLAEIFGIERESARHLVLRKQWRRMKGNDGRARIEVPLDALPSSPSSRPSDGPSHGTGGSTGEEQAYRTGDDTFEAVILNRHLERLECALEAAQNRLSEAEAARDAARNEARAIERERDEARAEARIIAAQVEALNMTLAVERERLADERARVDEWKAVADRFALQAEALAARPSRFFGWFRRWASG